MESVNCYTSVPLGTKSSRYDNGMTGSSLISQFILRVSRWYEFPTIKDSLLYVY